jgi:EmrB/QacA subfamily drug resistance transporter
MQGARRRVAAPLVLTVIVLGAFVTALDQTVVVTALPSVMLDLKVPFSELDRASWIVTGYLLGYTVAMPLIGRLGDVYGYSLVYRGGLVVFGIGTALVAVSPNLEWMVAARVVQAVGGGATVPIGLALASTALPGRSRGRALGIVIAAAEAGSMLGPAYGGAIIEFLDWRWIFWLNLPQSAVLFVALWWVPNQRSRGGRVDYLGGALLVATLLILSLAVSRQGLFTLSSLTPFIIAAPGLALVGLLVVAERRAWQPLLASFLFRSRAFVAANLTQLLEGVALIIAMVTVPLMAGTVMGKEPLTGAMWLLRLTAAIPLGAIVGGRLLGTIGVRPVAALGLGMSALGLFLVSGWGLDVSEPWLTVDLAIAGFGFGLNNTPIMTRAIDAAGEDYRGTAASLVVVARMMGMTLGLSALSAWGVEHFQTLTIGLELPLPEVGEAAEAMEARLADYNARLNAAGLSLFHNFFRAAGGVALVAILPALAMGGGKREREDAGKTRG